MQIDGVTRGTLESCLYWINEHFDGNIEFSLFQEIEEQKLWRISLRVIDVKKPGHSLLRPEVYGHSVEIPTGCYHCYLYFYLELPDEALVRVKHHWYSRVDMDFPTWEMKGYRIQDLCNCDNDAMLYSPYRRRIYNNQIPTVREGE